MNKIFKIASNNARMYIHRFAGLAFCILSFACESKKAGPLEEKPELKWEKLGPGGGGATFIPTFSYETPENFMVRCDMTGSYLTNNGGGSYHQVNFANGANAYAFDPDDPNSIWIGSTTLNHSTDGGKTWERVFPKKEEIVGETFHDDHASYNIETIDSSLYVRENGHIGTIRVDPAVKGAMYFSMGTFFFYSSDEGKTWNR